MKKVVFVFFILLNFNFLYSFDFNGIWSSNNISLLNWTYYEKNYSWGKVKEPCDCGFTIDLGKSQIYTNYTWYLNIDLTYENNKFSFINPLSKEKEQYYITIISDYEIILETDVEKDSLLLAKSHNNKNAIHYFKIAGPKDAKTLKAPVYAIVTEDSDLFVKDYKGVIHTTGHVKKGQKIEVWGINTKKIIEISEEDFNFGIRINDETGGYISPLKIEFLDDITINGYGGKK